MGGSGGTRRTQRAWHTTLLRGTRPRFCLRPCGWTGDAADGPAAASLGGCCLGDSSRSTKQTTFRL